MSSPLKTILMYVLLVVPPVGVLLLILDCGRHLPPPPRSIGGTWTVEPANACMPATLQVSQSGPNAQAQDFTFVIAGDQVTVTGHGSCQFTIDAHVTGDTLDGAVRPGCCPATAFHATRAVKR